MNEKILKKISIIILSIYIIAVLLTYLIAHDEFNYQKVEGETVSPATVIGTLKKGEEIRQNFTCDEQYLEGISVLPATYEKKANDRIRFSILDDTGTCLATKEVDGSAFEDVHEYTLEFDQMVLVEKNKSYTLVITELSDADAPTTFFYGNSINLARGTITKEYNADNSVYVNNNRLDAELYLKTRGINVLWLGQHYWYMAAIGLIVIVAYLYYVVYCNKKNRKNAFLSVLYSLQKYSFLVCQLVKRDFKTKYKRSALGVCWSFLNPLLTMVVQYVVFSTLFSTGVANYPVYLLTGIVLFNFFNEACTLGLSSITGNASLITKVYVPKYIYPMARVLSSLINLGLSLIPLFIVTFITGIYPKPAFLLLIYPLICLTIFSMGVSYLLSTLMVFFRDTQFIWNVLIMIWLYATPIFYTENIIPASALKIYHCNPLYQFITFARTILINGVSPAPMAYVYCFICSVIPFLFSLYIFKKNQDKFIFSL